MEAWIEAMFSQTFVDEAIDRFGIQKIGVKKLGDFENYVFEVEEKNISWILRFTHSSHRTIEEVKSELVWVNHLYDEGAHVARAYPSKYNKMIEIFSSENGQFFACLFNKVPGRAVKVEDPIFGSPLFEAWGKEIGKLHDISMRNKVSVKRQRWDAGDLLQFDRYLSKTEDARIIIEGKRLIEEIQTFHETGKTFGLIHSDVHHGNFHFDGKSIHLFDFDDSMYHYYISDIAIPVYYAVWQKCGTASLTERSTFATEFLSSFLRGYREEVHVSDEWLKTIPYFLRLRDFELYTVFHKKFDVELMSVKEKGMLDGIRSRLMRSELIAKPAFEELENRIENT
ncbi:phosphotransferase enzyme family protein [Anaerobacillus sp. 1_MG-2023]|uniref:phosphotransferase enzyme family protein n=1 Tax=Bacillales TaxID=1385 RepID=UPI0026E3B232|nr:phosphotransferase [Anaerobacillus sp. 1_MG-2023]MDO6654905.1 phosphotransferase [Anaerobacillus sp. 1_MG-2023]